MWLHVERVGFSYRDSTVLSEVEIAVPSERPIVVIVGPSGIGKTTLLKLLAGHLAPQHGKVTICGEHVTAPSASRPVVFQDHNLFPWLTVEDNIGFGLTCQGTPARERKALTARWIEHMRLEGVESYYPSMLSGGMKQRVGLARAMVVKPKCVLMDEPFSSLDLELRESLAITISELATQATKFVIVTHDLADAVFLGDIIFVLTRSAGLIAYDADLPRHPRVAAFRYTAGFREHLSSLKQLITTNAKL